MTYGEATEQLVPILFFEGLALAFELGFECFDPGLAVPVSAYFAHVVDGPDAEYLEGIC